MMSSTAAGTTWADIRPEWRFDANSDIGFGHSSFVDPASGYDPFNVHDGVLTITAVPDRTSSGYPGSWESGLITTQGNFSQTYGYYEIRANFSSSPGAWDAFWLEPVTQIPDPNNAGHWQELDVVENYGADQQSVYSTIHTTDPAPNLNWQQNLQVYSRLSQAGGYHTYGMDWEPDKISFYVDGQCVGSQPTPSDMHGPMYLIANLATQNDPSNNADAANTPISSSIDYIRVYAHSPTSSGTSGSGSTSSSGSTSTSSTTPTSSTPVNTTIGSGPDQLKLAISEDAYQGDAQYNVFVDGQQIGGTQTAHASHAAGQSDQVMVQGNWGSGSHDVTVQFLNDLWNGTPSTDRNLYVDGASFDGIDAHVQQALMSAGNFDFNVSAPTGSTTSTTPTSTAPANTVIGSGPDQLKLAISEDAYQGDAQYNVFVDGQQIGGTQAAHASHAAGQSDQVVVQGNWGSGSHDVTVQFLNDLWDGTPSTDRNLYVDGASYDGVNAHVQQALMSAGNFDFNVSSTTTPVNTVVGSGPDQLKLAISEDAYQGDARYNLFVDGQQIGGTQTAHALHAAGQSDQLLLQGNWGSGSHDLAVQFLNDLWDGTPSTDRNLYVDGASYNGFDAHAQQALMSAGTYHFLV
jgi:beta-glucanase (GH16 family)